MRHSRSRSFLLPLLLAALPACDDADVRPPDPFRSGHTVVGEITAVEGDPPTAVRLRDANGGPDGTFDALEVVLHPGAEVFLRDADGALLRVPPTFLEVGRRVLAFHEGDIEMADPPRLVARRIDLLPE